MKYVYKEGRCELVDRDRFSAFISLPFFFLEPFIYLFSIFFKDQVDFA